MRIAIGGIATECCTFSPILSKEEDFTVFEGDSLLSLERYPFLQGTTATILPTFYARALPGGKVERATYEAFKRRFLESLQNALPLDGLYLDMHGAMNVEGMDDAEGDWYLAARNVVGNNCLISASYDLHGNITERIINTLDMMTAFRTAPHVDVLETRTKAFRMLEQCLEEKIRPEKVWISVPVILPGERTSTEYEPTASLYKRLEDVDKIPGILDASILVGYVWADEPRSSASIVLTGTNRDTVESEAKKLAQAYWDLRTDFTFSVPTGTIDECIDWALASSEKSIFISDSGDNPTAGGVGDRADFLRRLLERNVPDAVLGGLVDAKAIDVCYQAGVGTTIKLTVGASLDSSSTPLTIEGKVIFLDDVTETRERQAVVQVGGITVILSHRRRPYHYEEDFTRLGIEPQKRKMTIVKVGYLVPDLKRIAKEIYLALSAGAVDQHIERLDYKRVKRPIYPLEKTFHWSAEQ
jgi:microcystin degradation protein MlrC